jgi:SAM-dependent methyltransferase
MEGAGMVIGEGFAWGHLEKTGGDATVDFFLAVPELIRFADPPSSAEKHTLFPSRSEDIRGKVLALNIRRLPSWMLSKALHESRYGAYPDYEPLPMSSPQQMAESSAGDRRLSDFTGNQELAIDRWLRTEFLADDFLAFISEFTDVPDAKQREIRELASVRRGTPLLYDHRVHQWFTPEQIRTMYEHNPAWASVERRLYGSEELPAVAPRRSAPSPNPPSQAPSHASPSMAKREVLARKALRTVDERARRGDAWEEEPSELERAGYDRQIELVNTRRYGNVLEIGSGAGIFTRRLAEIADRVVAIDVAPTAIARARSLDLDPAAVEFRLANIMDHDLRADGPRDLVVMSETIYELAWLYPLFDIAWVASELFAATRDGGRFLMANTYANADGDQTGALLSPWLIDTYRDLFLNVGYRCEVEEILPGMKHGVEYRTLVTLFSKPGAG